MADPALLLIYSFVIIFITIACAVVSLPLDNLNEIQNTRCIKID